MAKNEKVACSRQNFYDSKLPAWQRVKAVTRALLHVPQTESWSLQTSEQEINRKKLFTQTRHVAEIWKRKKNRRKNLLEWVRQTAETSQQKCEQIEKMLLRCCQSASNAEHSVKAFPTWILVPWPTAKRQKEWKEKSRNRRFVLCPFRYAAAARDLTRFTTIISSLCF